MSDVSTGGLVEHTLDDVLARLTAVADGAGERWRSRADSNDSYMAGVLHGLCIALATVGGGDSDELLHERMSGRQRRQRKPGEIRVVRLATSWTGGGTRNRIERWDGEKWEPLP